jgi:2,4-dienoyl-CoA reductase-like NADH-dependent reductase (Old Yellow Enzyme family)/NADPH-dependent 2,4-dienoyl-CoA reductase/sulfur reductase-like enzyme
MTEKNRYSALFQSGSIGSLGLKNRLIMAAMGNSLSDDQGNVTEAMLDYYRVRAGGGVGMVITQFASVSRDDVMPYNLGIYDDRFIAGISRLVNTIHEKGAKACIQLMSPGMLLLLFKSLPQGVTIKVPGITPLLAKDRPFQTLSDAEIEKSILDFGSAAIRVKEAGADAVEIHACHGCLLSTFLSPAINRREDLYGGSVDNRVRLVRLIVTLIKEKLGAKFPLIARINGEDDMPGGVTPEDVVRQAEILTQAGADAISISSGLEYWSTLMAPSYLSPEGVILPVVYKVKQAVKVPVIAAGKITPELAEDSITAKKMDFVALGRPLLADPALPDKLRQGSDIDVVKCLYCNNCLRTSWRSCTVNPFLFRESTGSMLLARSRKKIMVIGGGLAGMEAAVISKIRGHNVSLFEKESSLGGQWGIACMIPGKQNYASIISYLRQSLERLQIPVKLNAEINRDRVAEMKPEVAIIATGAVPSMMQIAGADQKDIYQANDVIQGKVEVKGKTVVLGGSILAMEAGILLAERGIEIILVSHSGLGGRKGPDDMITFRGLLRRLVDLRIPLFLNASILEKTGKSLTIGSGGEIITLPAETVVLAIGVNPVDNLVTELKGIVPEIYPIGDCVMPGNAAQATYSAARLAMKL